jgi:hypothetical protein
LKNHQGLWVAYGFHATILGVVEKGLWPIYTKWRLFKVGVSKKGKKNSITFVGPLFANNIYLKQI